MPLQPKLQAGLRAKPPAPNPVPPVICPCGGPNAPRTRSDGEGQARGYARNSWESAAARATRPTVCLTLCPLRRISAHPGEVRISPGLYFMTPLGGALFEAGQPKTPETGPQNAEQEKERPMYAVLKTGGKQYKVQAGDVLRVEKLAAVAGEKIQFNDILMVGGETVTVGLPFVAGAAVQAEVIDQIKGEKVIHFVKRRRKHSSQRTKGHRQHLTLVRITDVLASGADATGVAAATGTADARRAAHNTAPAAPVEAAPKPKRAAKAAATAE